MTPKPKRKKRVALETEQEMRIALAILDELRNLPRDEARATLRAYAFLHGMEIDD